MGVECENVSSSIFEVREEYTLQSIPWGILGILWNNVYYTVYYDSIITLKGLQYIYVK